MLTLFGTYWGNSKGASLRELKWELRMDPATGRSFSRNVGEVKEGGVGVVGWVKEFWEKNGGWNNNKGDNKNDNNNKNDNPINNYG